MAADGVDRQAKKIGKKKARVAKERPSLEPGVSGDGEHAGNSKLARALGSCDYHTREKGVSALTRFLQRKTDLAEKDMLKIWKGLFYAFWHSDKQPVQAELAERLAAVTVDLHPEVAYLYFTCFVKTMRREWFGIDRLRLDKFLMLIRKFVGQMFAVLLSNKWEAEMVQRYADFVRCSVLLPNDRLRAVGFAYHISDVFVPELCAVSEAAADAMGGGATAVARAAVPDAPLRVLLQPFVDVLQASPDAPMMARVREGVFDVLVEQVRMPTGDSEPAPLRLLDVDALASTLFGAGAADGTAPKCRDALYQISDAMERALARRRRLEAKAAAMAAASGATPSTSAQPASAPASDAAAPTHAVASGAPKGKKKSSAADGSHGATPTVAMERAAGEPLSLTRKRTPSQTGPSGAAVTHASTHRPATGTPLPAKGGPGEGGAKPKKRKASLQGDTTEGATGPGTSAPAPASASVLSMKKARLSGGAGPSGAPVAPPDSTADAHRAKLERKPAKGGAVAAVQPHANGDAVVATPKPSGTAPRPSALKSAAAPASAKKRVHINLRKNLYHDFGGPVPPRDVRTPLSARSKGGILKGVSSGTTAPGSAPAKPSGMSRLSVDVKPGAGGMSADKATRRAGGGGMRRVSSPRAKAELFF